MSGILIVDDHPLIRFAVRTLLEKEKYLVVGEAADGMTALDLTRKLKPDIVLLDLGMPGLDGFDVIERLQRIETKPKILILSGLNSDLYIGRCLRAGVAGFISKENDLANVVGAVRAVQMGFRCFPDAVTPAAQKKNNTINEQELINLLSNREVTVLRYLANGLSNKQIAENLLISHKTVSTYKVRLMQKLNANNVIELSEIVTRNFKS